jgi:UDP-3-O-acyl-N-acetylglucosamine deacetylase
MFGAPNQPIGCISKNKKNSKNKTMFSTVKVKTKQKFVKSLPDEIFRLEFGGHFEFIFRQQNF